MNPLSFFEKIINNIDEKFTSSSVHVVLGNPRSGTSLVSQLVHACGVYFGDIDRQRKGDQDNPRGYLEFREITRPTRLFFKEAGLRRSTPTYGLETMRARGFVGKLRRYFTRLKMKRVIQEAVESHDTFGFKSFPFYFYAWEGYLPKAKIIAVYRDPYCCVYSQMRKWPAVRRFAQAMELWTIGSEDLLYHISTKDSMLIKYEDLFDDHARSRVLTKLVDFVGGGDESELKKIIDPSLNRSSKAVDALRVVYPLDHRTKVILEALENQKV